MTPHPTRIPVLDGWRGISILCVLAGHMLPLGPKPFRLNEMFAEVGLLLFFILSGFLIVGMLLKNQNVASFLIRRFFRVVPLAWLYLVVVLALTAAPWSAWPANVLFYANNPPYPLGYLNGHFWSLCIEMQFYAMMAGIVAALGKSGLSSVPVLCLAVTLLRVAYGIEAPAFDGAGFDYQMTTWFRLDDILAGGCLALALQSERLRERLRKIPFWSPFALMALLLAGAHPYGGFLTYLKPYLAAATIASTIFRSDDALQRALQGPLLGYLATVSFALYVIHPATYAGWMGEGPPVARYAKRFVSFVATFALAHASTRYYENYWISMGHQLADRISTKPVPNNT